MTERRAELHERLRKAFAKRIPTGREIAKQAVDRALAGHRSDTQWIKENFSSLVESVQEDAYEIYLDAEEFAGAGAISEALRSATPAPESPDDVFILISRHFHSLDRFFLGLTQGRRPRAGNAFEFLIRTLFEALDYPFTPQPVINGKPDFVLPSIENFRRNPMDSIIFTVKRTCRERWRQIVTEGTRGLGFFLATIDENVGANDLRGMLDSRIRLIVPSRIKQGRYAAVENVVTFEQFFRFHLDPAMERWRAAGVICRHEIR
jgi:hypothetical protein